MSGGIPIAGYASLFSRRDGAGDTVVRGAFARSLARRGADGIRMLWQHDPARPIGVWERVAEDGAGLYVAGRLLADVAQAREAASLIGAGALDGLSIGFRTVRARAGGRGAARVLTEIDLWEVSLVTFPELAGARVRLVGPPRSPYRRSDA
ncbi:HK97 family phage prohead protease [Polymorphum gilvum]|uniref:Phage prohead protease, HK97 family protein n=1 Tax=Polymorphum gilvum (strain LMG 25793 / CGMCC 1.9160 / SL003B-26A1) TaxID=991905 RepID=F2IV22_POLGS|nr:HK97 family phage prohead protease [Polymorphum gilvum]ADZ71353.1 Phage prohead protease, HK97 family protein [Polymorphum gilvum SL003B-26A1]